MKIFLTGSSGFIGNHLVKALSKNGHELTCLTRKKSLAELGEKYIHGDLTGNYDADLSGIDIFAHFAAAGVAPELQNDWDLCMEVNVNQSLKLVRSAIAQGIENFLICGSCFEYGKAAEKYENVPVDSDLQPTAAYHSSKAAFTMLMSGLTSQYGLKTIVIRPFHIFGKGENVSRFWPSIVKAAESGADFEMTDGEQIRDFTNVEHAVKVVCELLPDFSKMERGEMKIQNIGTGAPISLRAFAESIWENSNATGRLMIGAKEQRAGEVMRFVPEL